MHIPSLGRWWLVGQAAAMWGLVAAAAAVHAADAVRWRLRWAVAAIAVDNGGWGGGVRQCRGVLLLLCVLLLLLLCSGGGCGGGRCGKTRRCGGLLLLLLLCMLLRMLLLLCGSSADCGVQAVNPFELPNYMGFR